MDDRDELPGRGTAWRGRDLVVLATVAGWTTLIVMLFPSPAPTPPAVPYSLARPH